MTWISTAVPIVNEKMPGTIDYVLPVLFGISILTLTTYPLLSVLVMFVAGPYWIWRSLRGALYYKQHKSNIRGTQLVALVLTNAVFYGNVLWILQNVFHLL